MTAETVRVVAVFKSRSSKRRGESKFYRVVCSSNGQVTCECPGFTYRGKCWHVERTIEKLAEKYQ